VPCTEVALPNEGAHQPADQAEVVHRQENPVTKTFEYYVHYCDCASIAWMIPLPTSFPPSPLPPLDRGWPVAMSTGDREPLSACLYRQSTAVWTSG
jgi:hypothetical protein